jgi:alkaline phosphatase D
MHAALPMIGTVDDHEFADGAWRDGAAEHDDVRDGPWSDRKATAFAVREEWLPVRRPDPDDPSRVFRSVRLGDLAELFLLDTRSRRDEPVPPPACNEEGRSALGPDQRAWLFDGLSASTARWRILGNPSVMARTWDDGLPDAVKTALVKVKLMDSDKTGPDWDQWDGYPDERNALLARMAEGVAGNVVVLSGDVHVGMVNELHRHDTRDGDPVAVEFVNASLTSQNLDDKMGWQPHTESLALADVLVDGMPHIRWVDFDSHGYNLVTVDPERIRVEWFAVDTVLERCDGERRVAAWQVAHGRPVAEEVDAVG